MISGKITFGTVGETIGWVWILTAVTRRWHSQYMYDAMYATNAKAVVITSQTSITESMQPDCLTVGMLDTTSHRHGHVTAHGRLSNQMSVSCKWSVVCGVVRTTNRHKRRKFAHKARVKIVELTFK